MDKQPEIDQPARLAAHGQRVLQSGVLGKSRRMIRLFEFLLAQAVSGVATKEIEIAQVVFGRTTEVDLTADATVRVHIHRLRKKLDDMAPDELGEKLTLPRGEYRLVVIAAASSGVGVLARHSRRSWGLAAAAALLLLAVNGAGWTWLAKRPPADMRTQSLLWQGVNQGSAPVLLVSGDFYVFGEQAADGTIARLVADAGITSGTALEQYQRRLPSDAPRYIDLNAYHLPSGQAAALVAVAPVAAATRPGHPEQLRNVTTSRFTTQMLSDHDIVYVGLLDGLGDLKEPFLDLSGFSLSADGEALVDKASGQIYRSDWDEPSTERIMRHDYAYLARFPGPAGNHVIVVAGVMDPALVQAANIAASATELARLQDQLHGAQAFEALYEVRTFGPSNVAAELRVARALEAGQMWQVRGLDESGQ
ncbi:helix-turn-helix domain-containing protein [Pseudomonas sp. JBR1]|uniref:helix-turn-helix domain-containing protein n=1 Tax=Pseudomonas sp. JBR1 TaxID=3020907 RepID=UPI00230683E5|nr:helix-turn-helix domain-containing protein [Pseudomonas sp. JBR1]WCE09056.1 helix-turn-helix domain-containing protein [Pseudomonas sp. JBR1]